jgi:hypothetical protein
MSKVSEKFLINEIFRSDYVGRRVHRQGEKTRRTNMRGDNHLELGGGERGFVRVAYQGPPRFEKTPPPTSLPSLAAVGGGGGWRLAGGSPRKMGHKTLLSWTQCMT